MGKIYWHLPGFVYLKYLNQVTINLMKDYPEAFHDGYTIGSVYGTFPCAIWNGGRAVFGLSSKEEMTRLISTYNKNGIPVRFTWTNSELKEEHVHDTYCNLIMRIADNGMNQVLVNTPVLEDYLREHYPSFGYISSTTKCLTKLDDIKAELAKDYELVVLDYNLNHNEEILTELEPVADRIEILVDEICFPNCPKRKEHYSDESKMQLEFSVGTTFDCPNKHTDRRSFDECKSRPAFISKEDIDKYADRGYVNFKIVGRGLPPDMVKESYLYYLVKDESRVFIRNKMDAILNSISAKQRR